MIKIIQQEKKKTLRGYEYIDNTGRQAVFYNKLESTEDLEKRVNNFCITNTVESIEIIAVNDLITFIIVV